MSVVSSCPGCLGMLDQLDWAHGACPRCGYILGSSDTPTPPVPPAQPEVPENVGSSGDAASIPTPPQSGGPEPAPDHEQFLADVKAGKYKITAEVPEPQEVTGGAVDEVVLELAQKLYGFAVKGPWCAADDLTAARWLSFAKYIHRWFLTNLAKTENWPAWKKGDYSDLPEVQKARGAEPQTARDQYRAETLKGESRDKGLSDSAKELITSIARCVHSDKLQQDFECWIRESEARLNALEESR